MIFYCKDCDKEFEIDDNECEGYYNWKCPDCLHIAAKKDTGLGLGILWNCDTGTVKRQSYINSSSSPAPASCKNCPNSPK